MGRHSPLLVPGGWGKLRTELEGTRREMFRRLTEQCARYRRQTLPAEHPMASITYFGMAAANLACAYRLTGQAQYLEEARRWIFTAVGYPHWGRAVKVDVDLSAAWLLFGLGLSYDWLREDLTRTERIRLRDKLILQGECMAAYAVTARGTSWPTEYWQNHNWIDFTGLATAGYALAEEYPPAAGWIAMAREDMTKVFPLLPQDGSDYEGITYWRYGVPWLALYAELLRQTEGIDLFTGSDFLKNTIWYRLYQMAPDREQNFTFGDCHDRRSGHSVALFYKLASEYRIGQAQWLAGEVLHHSLFREGYESGLQPGILPEAFLELLWYDPSVAPEPPDGLPAARSFPDLGLVSVRSGWDVFARALSFKCSSGGGAKQWELTNRFDRELGFSTRSMGHHHPDANSFQIVRGSDFLAVDEGYSARKMAAHHNLVLVDGRGYEGDGGFDVYRDYTPDRTARLEAFGTVGPYAYMRGESARMYCRDLQLETCRREILCAGVGVLIVCDRMASAQPHIYSWQLHADNAFWPVGPLAYRTENGASRLDIRACGEGLSLRTETVRVQANPTSQEPSKIITTEMQTLVEENSTPVREIVMWNVLCVGSSLTTGTAVEVIRTAWGRAAEIPGDIPRLIVWNPQSRPIDENVAVSGVAWPVHTRSAWTVWERQGGAAVCRAKFEL